MRRVTRTLSRLEWSPSATVQSVLDLDWVKRQRRVTSIAIDDLFVVWIEAAAGIFEEQTGRVLITSPWEYWLDCFPPTGGDDYIEIPKAPLQSVTAVTYIDGGGDEQTLDTDTYEVIAPSGLYCPPGRIQLTAGNVWPATAYQGRAVRIAFTAGYGENASEMPSTIRTALSYLVGHFHKHGEETEAAALHTVPIGASSLMRQFQQTAKPTQGDWTVPWQA